MIQKPLLDKLANAKSEEDVKQAFVEILKLSKHFTLHLGKTDMVVYGRKDITKQVPFAWFEAKDEKKMDYKIPLAQLCANAKLEIDKGLDVPQWFVTIAPDKASIAEIKNNDFLHDSAIMWPKNPSDSIHDKKYLKSLRPFLKQFSISTYDIPKQADVFYDAFYRSLYFGEVARKEITLNNMKRVFEEWIVDIGYQLKPQNSTINSEDYAILFIADIMFDEVERVAVSKARGISAELRQFGDDFLFQFGKVGSKIIIGDQEKYKLFWTKWHRPPRKEERKELLRRIDKLKPVDKRIFKGAFYTPKDFVYYAYEKLDKILGEDWQDNYYIWDMACGLGNLQIPAKNPHQVFLSTLDQADLDIIDTTDICKGAEFFQYDYLNDHIDDFRMTTTSPSPINYGLSKKMPDRLRRIIREINNSKDGKTKDGKKLLVLINPPYAEATNANNAAKSHKGKVINKKGVAIGKKITPFVKDHYGQASKELFTQFLARIHVELPKCTLAVFSTLKYINAPNFEKFRERWQAEYLGGFIFHSKNFEGLNGDFPIGFLIWDMAKPQAIDKIITDIVDYNDRGKLQIWGQKLFFPTPSKKLLNIWIDRPPLGKNPILAVPLSSVFKPYPTEARVKSYPKNSIGYFMVNSNDFQSAHQMTYIMSSVVGRGNGMYITPENLWQVAVVFTTRQIEKHTWINHNDQFYQANKELSSTFKNDCFVWMLWHDKNLTASCTLEWEKEKWQIKNHFVPFLESDVRAKGNFDSYIIHDHLKNMSLSHEATNLMAEGKKLWTLFHQSSFNKKVEEEYQLTNPTVGWYQVRRALESTGHDFTDFKNAYNILTEKLRPQCYQYGFIKK